MLTYREVPWVVAAAGLLLTVLVGLALQLHRRLEHDDWLLARPLVAGLFGLLLIITGTSLGELVQVQRALCDYGFAIDQDALTPTSLRTAVSCVSQAHSLFGSVTADVGTAVLAAAALDLLGRLFPGREKT